MLEERRQFPRLVPSTPLFVSMDDAKSGLLLDLCEGGLAVASLVPRNLDDVVSLAFDLPEGVGHIEAKARIAWTRDSGHLTGVRFMDLDEVSQQQLCEWIAAGTYLRPAGSEELDEPVIVTRSTYAQVDAIRRDVRLEMPIAAQPRIETWTPETGIQKPSVAPILPMAAEMAGSEVEEFDTAEAAAPAMMESSPSAEMTGSLFPESMEEQPFTEDAAELEIDQPAEALQSVEAADDTFGVPETAIAESTTLVEAAPATPGSTSRAEWVEHVAQLGDAPAGFHLDAGSQTLPPDAETVGWASDAVGWVQEIAEKRITAPEEAEFDGVFAAEPVRTTRPAKSRHTIELVLAVVLLTWALVFLGYQMGSTGASHVTHDASLPKGNGASLSGVPANANNKGDGAKVGTPSSASFASAEAFPDTNPIPPVTAGRSSTAPSNSNAASLETPKASRSVVVASRAPAPTPNAPTKREAANPTLETVVLAGAAPVMNSGVILQVGAMKMEGNATALMQDLKKKKFTAFVYRHGNDSLYRVGVGPFGDRDSSAKVKSELERNGYPAIMAKWQKDKG
jgi:cell division septation protein DedD